MTRMRFCTPQGIMEFHTKGETTQAPAGHLPWLEVPGRISADSVLVTGHWSALGLKLTPNLLALDSGCLCGLGTSPRCGWKTGRRSRFDCPPGRRSLCG